MSWLYDFPQSPPLTLTATVERDLRKAVTDARKTERSRGVGRSPDARLPRGFATQLIRALKPDPNGDPSGILQRVESQASRADLLNSTKAKARASSKQLKVHWTAVRGARDFVAQFWPHGSPGAAALPGLDATIKPLNDLIEMHERVLRSNWKGGGPPRDSWRLALIVELCRWWKQHGWRPTTKDQDAYARQGVFAAVVIALLNARNAQLKLGKRAMSTINIRAELKALNRLTDRELMMLDITKLSIS